MNSGHCVGGVDVDRTLVYLTTRDALAPPSAHAASPALRRPRHSAPPDAAAHTSGAVSRATAFSRPFCCFGLLPAVTFRTLRHRRDYLTAL